MQAGQIGSVSRVRSHPASVSHCRADGSDTAGLLQAGWVYAVLGVALSVLGAGLAWSTSGGRHGGRFEKEMAWPAAS